MDKEDRERLIRIEEKLDLLIQALAEDEEVFTFMTLEGEQAGQEREEGTPL